MFDTSAYILWLRSLLPFIFILLVLIVLVVVSGVLSGLKAKTFTFTYIADFLRTLILPKLGGWLLLETLGFFLGIVPPETIPSTATNLTSTSVLWLGHVAYGLLFASLGAKLFTNLKELDVIPVNPE
jgi:hypothetical protein